ncbi:hypothetical protein FS837_006015 [Tulasnella sp. UAMH 9824]|nr:hypothetical protein FS837_006015 [Tulasnella sp. UAMH 9824]
MQAPGDMDDTFVHHLRRLALFMSDHAEDHDIDRRTLAQCEENLGTLRSVQKLLERRVASVGRRRNTFAPINALPPELLVTIFMFTIDDDWGGTYASQATLALVCSHWYHLVNDSPSLWTDIRNLTGTPLAWVTRALEKSKGAPLNITFTSSWGMEPAAQNVFLDAIFPHAHRWKAVSLWLEGQAQGLEAMATLSAPLLEYFSLSIDEHGGWAPDQPLNIFGGQRPPRLRELDLAGVPIPWNPTIFCQLTSLSISRIFRLGPSVDQLLAVLSTCSNLESLSIREVTFSGSPGALSPNPTPMPALKRLALCELSPATSNGILGAIRAPNCKTGELSCYINRDPLETLFTSDISHFFDHMRSNVNAGSIACSLNRIMITWTGQWTINLNMGDTAFLRRTVNWLSTSTDPSSGTPPLDLSIYGMQPPMIEDTLAAVSDMESLRQISLGPDISVVGALALLATFSLAEGGARWPFPGLEELLIGVSMNDDEWERLLHALRTRQGEQEGQADIQQPKPLRKLEFLVDWTIETNTMINNFSSIYWPNYLGEIRRLLGPKGELIWYGRAVTLEGVMEDAHEFGIWNN